MGPSLFELLFMGLFGAVLIALLLGSLWGHALREFAEGDALPPRARIRGMGPAGHHAVYGTAVVVMAIGVGALLGAVWPFAGKFTSIVVFGIALLATGSYVTLKPETPRRWRVARAYVLATAMVFGLIIGFLWVMDSILTF